MKLLPSLFLLALSACNPLSLFAPPSLPTQGSLRWQSEKNSGPESQVDITIDEFGVPHIFGDSDNSLAFGLGFMQARDRLFQVDLMRKVAQGRASELFAERALDSDRKLRILAFGLQEQYAALSPRDKELLQSFANGINEGARHAGRSAEHRILRVDFTPFEPFESLAIARLQAWDLAQNLDFELLRFDISQVMSLSDKLAQLVLAQVSDGGIPISTRNLHNLNSIETLPLPVLDGKTSTVDPVHKLIVTRKALRTSQKRQVFLGAQGGAGSNSWVVSGSKTQSGKPILCNDPHLVHRAPSTFYLAHLTGNEFSAAGATLAGVPGIVIGHSMHVAWGVTASYADVQDLVKLELSAEGYLSGGKIKKFDRQIQKFLGKNGEILLEEEWLSTQFGPVLPPFYGRGNNFALMWPAFFPGSINSHPVSSFFQLMKAKTTDQAMVAGDGLAMAAINLVYAGTDGDIAYKLSAGLPVRKNLVDSHSIDTEAPWIGFLAPHLLPVVKNPPSGYIVAANQRIVDASSELEPFVGTYAATPHRAQRIKERIEQLLKDKQQVNSTRLLDIQQDAISTEARRLSPILGKYCPKQLDGFTAAQLQSFCSEISNFDAHYSLTSIGALPYSHFLHQLKMLVFREQFGEALAFKLQGQASAMMALEDALIQYPQGQLSPLFRGKTGEDKFEAFLKIAAQEALTVIHKQAGHLTSDWRWGKNHLLQNKGPLSELPIIGGLFSTKSLEQSGHSKTPRAEASLPGAPVWSGAVFRMVAEMTSPPRVQMILETGNGGSSASTHYQDMFSGWNSGDLISLPMTNEEINQRAQGRITLLPTLNHSPTVRLKS